MNRLLCFLCFIFIVTKANTQNTPFKWVRISGDTLTDEGRAVSLDTTGNIYTTGQYEGTVDFDPGNGVNNLTSVGENDIFISKTDPNGNFIWARKMGGIGYDGGRGITIDVSGNVYVVGYFHNTVDFDPGNGVFNLTAGGNSDIFVLKLNTSGNFIWARRFGGTSDEGGNAIAIDNAGNVYNTGYFYGTADFDPGSGTYNLTASGTNADAFISKLDMSGNFVWAYKIGTSNNDVGYGIKTDNAGNLYTTGCFTGSVDFNPGTATNSLTSASTTNDVFICKWDTASNFIWAKKMGATFTEQGNALALDDSCNVLLTGIFGGTVDFDPGSGTANLSASGTRDLFVCKLDSSGNFRWARRFGGSGLEDYGNGIATDAAGSVYTTGYFNGTSDFDPGSGIYNLTASGVTDIFVSKLNASGNFLWAKKFGGVSNIDFGYGIGTDKKGNVYTVGGFGATVDFDGDTTVVFNATSKGEADIFIHKMGACQASFFTQNPIVCAGKSFTVGIHNYSISGNYKDTLTAINGCDSIITTNLTVLAPITFSQNKTLCFGQTLNVGIHQYSSSGIYRDTLQSVRGCDSIITTNLTIKAPISFTQNISVCFGKSFTVGTHTYTVTGNYKDTLIAKDGCDSFITTNLTVRTLVSFTQNQTICNGKSITVGSRIYTTTGVYKDTLITVNGCDSIITTNLIVTSAINVTLNPVICAGTTFKVGTHTYAVSGVYKDTVISSGGCDSIITTNLNVLSPISFSHNPVLCFGKNLKIGNNTYNASGIYKDTLISYRGCDSIVMTNLTILAPLASSQQPVLCHGDSFKVGNKFYATSGTFKDTLTGVNGCDSIITTLITVLPVIDVSTTKTGNSIKANLNGAQYQWLNCNNGYLPISGAINQTYNAGTNGNYAVKITVASCIDTSSCISITGMGINYNAGLSQLLIYPNPNDGHFVVRHSNPELVMKIEVFDYRGALLFSDTSMKMGELKIDLSEMSNGLYLVKTTGNDGVVSIQKVWKK